MRRVHQIPEWNRFVESDPRLGLDPCIHETATVLDSSLGEWTEVGPYSEIVDSVVGDYSYIAGVHTSINNAEVGKFCSIASSVRINPVNHPMHRTTQHHCTYRRTQYGFDEVNDADIFATRREARVFIDHDVWIGHGVIIMPGVKIGMGAAIGSGAVITKDVEPYAIVVGVHGREIRKRFSQEVIDKITESKWWNWTHAELRERFDELLDPEKLGSLQTVI